MNRFRVTIFQRRLPSGALRWTTLGLGRHDVSVTGATVPAARRQLTELLKARVATAQPGELPRFRLARGLQLEALRLSLDLRGAGGRRRFTGRFPIVVEPRPVGPGEAPLLLAYHPERPRDWLPVRGDGALADQAAPFFSKAWADLDTDDLEDLAGARKSRLRIIEISARAPGLLDHLPDRARGLWADLEVDPYKGRGGAKQQPAVTPAPKVLPKVGSDLTVRAVDGSLPVGNPRSPWRERLQLLLGPGERTSVVVVGPPGVGKRTLLYHWVADLARAEGFAVHQNLDRIHHVWTVAGKRIIAGMQYIGDWEQRCVDLLADCATHKAILLVEDLAAWGRIGRTRDSDRCLADVFRGPMTRGELVLVATCTPDELARLEDDAPAFAGRFVEVHLPPADRAATLEMMIHEARRLEATTECQLQPDVYPAILDELVPVIPGAALPGAALDLLRLTARENQHEPYASGQDASYAAANRLALPPDAILGVIGSAYPRLAARVLGQEQAVRAAAAVVDRVWARLDDPRRPYGVLLFSGPTGTGKTELAKALASVLFAYGAAGLVQLDMSELGGPDAVERLVGAPWRPEGRLTQPIIEQPFNVVLLDEIEKVHPSALNLLLQVLDEGRLTDASGRVADFTRAVIIMTSNLGATGAASLGFGAAPDAHALEHAVVRAAEGFFPPELFNRIDRVVAFQPLSPEIARSIAALQLARLLGSPGLAERRVHVTAAAAVIDRAVAAGYDPALGARPLRRWLEREVGGLLADWLAELTTRGYHLAEIAVAASGRLLLRSHTLVAIDPMDGVADPVAMQDEGLAELKARVPRAVSRLNALLTPAAREAMSARIDALLGARAGDDDDGAEGALRRAQRDQAIYYHDALRRQLDGVRRRLGRLQQARAVQPDELRDALSQVPFLARAAGHIDEVARHEVVVELRAIGGRPLPSGGLLAALVKAYGASERTTVEGFAAARRSGVLDHDQLEYVASGADAVVLRVGGLDASDLLAGEEGFHAWESLAGSVELARVTVRPATAADSDDRALRARALDLARADAGEADARGALVRRLLFDPHRDGKTATPAEVEDHRLGLLTVMTARSADEVIARCVALRAGRAAGGEEGTA